MKSNLIAVSALASALVSSVVTPSWAAVSRTTFRGENVNASFFTQTAITCDDGSSGSLDTSFFVIGFSQVVRSTSGNTDGSTLFVSFSELNTCTQAFRSAFNTVNDPDYEQRRTDSASLAGAFDLIDDATGEPIGTLTMDLDLTGTGATTRSNSHSTVHSGDFLFVSRAAGTFRQANVSGTLSLDGVEFVGGFQFAQLAENRSGDLTVTH
jgi:hypothetical protein